MTLLDDTIIPDQERYSTAAPLSKRIGNGLVDLLAVSLLTYLSLWLIVQVTKSFTIFEQGDFTLPMLFLIVHWLYYFTAEASGGRTLGKWLSGTTVRSTNGAKPSSSALVLRTTLRLIPFYPLLFMVGLRWHDRLANCEVFENHPK